MPKRLQAFLALAVSLLGSLLFVPAVQEVVKTTLRVIYTEEHAKQLVDFLRGSENPVTQTQPTSPPTERTLTQTQPTSPPLESWDSTNNYEVNPVPDCGWKSLLGNTTKVKADKPGYRVYLRTRPEKFDFSSLKDDPRDPDNERFGNVAFILDQQVVHILGYRPEKPDWFAVLYTATEAVGWVHQSNFESPLSSFVPGLDCSESIAQVVGNKSNVIDMAAQAGKRANASQANGEDSVMLIREWPSRPNLYIAVHLKEPYIVGWISKNQVKTSL